MFNPCEDNLRFHQCQTLKCRNLRLIDIAVSAFFFFEMIVKMLSQCAVGHSKAYLASGWNRLDFAIVIASFVDYVTFDKNEDATASDWAFIRVIRILRPLRAIKRIPSLRLLVTLLTDTLPALSSIIIIIVFSYFIFGIIGVQLWAGDLRQRCFLKKPNQNGTDKATEAALAESEDGTLDYYFEYDYVINSTTSVGNVTTPLLSQNSSSLGNFSSLKMTPTGGGRRNINRPVVVHKVISLPIFYESPSLDDFTCGGFLQCSSVAAFEKRNSMCETLYHDDEDGLKFCSQMIPNYSKCKPSDANPFDGGVSFDNIIIASITIFQAVSPEGWSTIMYTVQDAFSFWAWPYFVFLVIVMTFGVSNLSFIIIAIQIPRCKRRLLAKMKKEEQEEQNARVSVKTWLSAVNRQLPLLMPGLDGGQLLAGRNQQQVVAQIAREAREGKEKVNAEIQERQNRNFYTLLVDLIVDFVRQHLCSRLHFHCWGVDGDIGNERTIVIFIKKWLRRISYKVELSRQFLKRVLQHSGCVIFMSIAIFVNTISLAVEHHDQPRWLTQTVDSLNIALTTLFTVELVVTVYAYGFIAYIRNGFNTLDLVIVIVSLAELAQDGSDDSGLSVLRTFRLLRIFKLLRFSPTVQNQLFAIFRTINNVTPFILLFGLFVFVFVVLGVLLFGCEFCTDSTVIYQNNRNITDLADEEERSTGWIMADTSVAGACKSYNKRHQDNFYSLLSALLTVLRVLTQDDGWSQVVRDTMFYTSSYWPAAYFVSLLMFGNYVLLSMLLAIIDTGSSPTAAKMLEDTPGAMKQFGSLLSIAASWRHSDCLVKEYHRSARRRRGSYSRAIGRYNVLELNEQVDDGEVAAGKRHRFAAPTFSRYHDRLMSHRSAPAFLINTRRMITPMRRNNSYKFAVAGEDNDFELVIDEAAGCPELRMPSATNNGYDDDDGDENSNSQCDDRIKNPSLHSDDATSCCSSNYYFSSPTKLSPVLSTRCHHNETTGGTSSALQLRIKGLIAAKIAFSSLKRKASILVRPGRILKQSQKPKVKKKVTIPLVTIEDGEENLPKNDQVGDDGETKRKTQHMLSLPMINDDRWRDYSLFLFHYDNPLRKFFKWIVLSPRYDHIMLFVVVANCITVAIERPSIEANSFERHCLDAANSLFNGIFFTEAVIKILADGFISGQGAYLHSGWNILDFMLVILSLVDFFIDFTPTGDDGDDGLKAFRALRLLRAFKPLRAINRTPGLKVVTRMLGISIKSIANILLICAIFFVAFAVLGLQLFRGCYYNCAIATGTVNNKINQQLNLAAKIANQSSIVRSSNMSAILTKKPTLPMVELKKYLEEVKTRRDCLAVEGLQWQNEIYNFDNFAQALKSLMVIATFDGWIEITQNGLDCVDIDMQPIHNYAPWRVIYFIAFLLLIAFCVVEVFVGVILNNYKHMKGYLVREGGKTFNVIAQAGSKMKFLSSRLGKRRSETMTSIVHPRQALFWLDGYPRWRRNLFQMCNHFYLDVVIAVLIVANILVMAAEYYKMPRDQLFVVKLLDNSFTAIFALEAILKMVAFGPSRYFHNKWNRLDFAVVFLTVVNAVLEEIEAAREVPLFEPGIIRVVQIFRVMRAVKLLKVAKGVQSLLVMVQNTFAQVASMGLLFLVIFFIYAAFGVELLGRLHCPYNSCDGLSRHANFHNFGMAMLTLFRVATGDNWKALFEDTLDLASDPNTRCFSRAVNVSLTRVNEMDKYSKRVVVDNKNITTTLSTPSAASSPPVNDCALVIALGPFYFTSLFVITQFFLVNVVTACLMHQLEEAEKRGLLDQETNNLTASFKQSASSSSSSEEDNKDESASIIFERDDRLTPATIVYCREQSYGWPRYDGDAFELKERPFRIHRSFSF